MNRNIKYTCGDTFPSGCVLYSGEFPDFIDSEEFNCVLNLDRIMELYGGKIDSILSDINLTTLSTQGLSFNPATVTVKELHQVEINKLANLESRLATIESAVGNLNIGSKLITINLDCLTPQAAPCAQGTNTYTLLSILQIFRAEICAIKNHLNL
jgi:hypothetical protein